jgi:long-subunit fatty acid transport protein
MFAFFPKTSWSQMVLGQYEDEAPFRTWNTFGITTAASLAMGETQFTSSYDCAVSLTNPSLLTRLPKVSFTANSSFNTASFFRYSIVNTGPLTTNDNLSLSLTALDFAGASIRLKDWTLALSISLIEYYNRPQTAYEYPPGGTLLYSLGVDQRGDLKNINFSVARKLSGTISTGIGLNYVYGLLEKDVIENWPTEPRFIADNKSHKFQGFYVNGGLLWEFTDRVELAAIFRTPYMKKSESENFLRYFAPAGDTDITLEVSSRDEYKQPFVAGIGVSYKFSSEFRAATDLTFFNWSKYRVNYFEEDLERDLKNIIKVGVGIEYLSAGRMFGQEIKMPLRAGFSYDPQPMKDPNSSYIYLSLGTGIHWGKFLLDAGVLLGWERGSGNSLSARKVAVSLSFRL